MRFGKHFMPLSREDWMFAQDLLAVEFSPNDFTYAIGPSLGAFFHYSGDSNRGWIGVHNGAFGGEETFPAPESDVSSTVRWEWNVQGDDWTVWDDMVGRRGRERVTMIGLSGGYQTAKQNTVDRDGAQINADLNLNGDGYQAVLAGSATWRELGPSGAFWNYGLMAQLGVFVTDHGQIYGQYNLVDPGDQPGGLDPFHSVALGYNHFPFLWTNRWKFSAEAGLVAGAVNDTIVAPSGSLGVFPSDDSTQAFVRVQAQVGF